MTDPVIGENGELRWMNSAGQLHRLDGPALVHTNVDAFWFLNGELHREDGPACELSDGGRTWFSAITYVRTSTCTSKTKCFTDRKSKYATK